jgi:hypothetical protein
VDYAVLARFQHHLVFPHVHVVNTDMVEWSLLHDLKVGIMAFFLRIGITISSSRSGFFGSNWMTIFHSRCLRRKCKLHSRSNNWC